MHKPENFKAYLADYPPATRKLLRQLRGIVVKNARGAEEIISYGMPAFMLHGRLIYFAGYERHIGFYPMPSAIANFKKELQGYKTAKGSIQFPLNRPLPVALIAKIVKFRVEENLAKEAWKTALKKESNKKKKSSST